MNPIDFGALIMNINKVTGFKRQNLNIAITQ